MGLDSYAVLGNTLDEYDDEDTQEDVNINSIHMYHQKRLLDSIHNRTSRYELKYLFEELSRTTPEFWMLVLKEIIKVYTLNSLRPFTIEGYSNIDIVRETRKLLVFIKVILVSEKIDITISRKEFKDKLEKLNPPELMRIAIDFIDDESLKSLIKTLVRESRQDYYEE
jgi:hypothetical protein